MLTVVSWNGLETYGCASHKFGHVQAKFSELLEDSCNFDGQSGLTKLSLYNDLMKAAQYSQVALETPRLAVCGKR